MLTKGAITDLIAGHLARQAGGGARPGPGGKAARARRVFISDYKLRRLLAPGARAIKVPANAILSPLSLDWLDYEGIKVVRE